MTGRDRIVVIVLSLVAVLAAAWILAVSPKRQQATKLDAQIAAAQSQLSAAEGQLSGARAAQAQYASAYTSIVNLGKAVPASQEVPSLIYQLEKASNSKKVEFASIVTTTPGAAVGSSSGTAAGAASAAGFSQMPFTFVFNGTYFDLEHLFEGLNHFTVRTASGALQISGRLLTIQSLKLSPLAPSTAPGGASGPGQLTGTITASAYVLPASQGLTGSAPAAPGTAPASSTAPSSSPTAPAIVRVTP
jgi:hypothetical protein